MLFGSMTTLDHFIVWYRLSVLNGFLKCTTYFTATSMHFLNSIWNAYAASVLFIICLKHLSLSSHPSDHPCCMSPQKPATQTELQLFYPSKMPVYLSLKVWDNPVWMPQWLHHHLLCVTNILNLWMLFKTKLSKFGKRKLVYKHLQP